MPQQINLLDACLQRQPERVSSTTGLLVVAATLVAAIAAGVGLTTLSARSVAQAEATERELATLQARVIAAGGATASPLGTELARLRAAEAAQQRVRAALDSGQAGVTQGYSDYLFALSRQAQESLWLTRFNVAPDARSLDIGGRMTDPRQLPDYLRRLKLEPLFKGRQFAQLSLQSVELAEGMRVTEFALRSGAAASAPELKP